MNEREHGEMEIIMNGTGKTHPPVTLDKARDAWGGAGPFFCKRMQGSAFWQSPSDLSRGWAAAGSRGRSTSSFLLEPPASASISLHLPPASSKTGSLIRSLCPHSGSNPPASRWCSGSLRIMPSRVRLRLLVGSKATVMATGLCHIAQEAMKNPDSLWHSEWGIRCL